MCSCIDALMWFMPTLAFQLNESNHLNVKLPLCDYLMNINHAENKYMTTKTN